MFTVRSARDEAAASDLSGDESFGFEQLVGGGYGGSTVNLVQRNAVGRFKELIMDSYQKATNIKPTVFITDAGNGANEILSAAFAPETSLS